MTVAAQRHDCRPPRAPELICYHADSVARTLLGVRQIVNHSAEDGVEEVANLGILKRGKQLRRAQLRVKSVSHL